MASPTPNKGMTYPAHGGAVDAWDTPLNQNFDQLDQNLGGSYNITLSSTTAAVTYNSSFATAPSTVSALTLGSTGVAQNLNYVISGTIASNLTISFPGVGGFYGITNDSSGAFTVTVNTVTAGSSGTVVSQGSRVFVIADATNVRQADTSAQAKFYSYSGDPNGNVSGTVATVNGGLTDAIWDFTNQQLYLTTTTGSTATTVWTPQIPRVPPQGYLTIATDNNNPVVASNVTAATTLKYVPFNGDWTVLSNGTILFPYQFSAMTLSLTASQAASIIYDVFMFYNSGAPVIGTGPAWSVSTSGAGSRGTGAGTTQLNRFQGIWTNAVQVTLTNGASTYVCSANHGIYLGSIFMDSVAGQLSCLVSYGQNRKWGVWNAYNRKKITMEVGDSTASWSYTTATFRPSNNSTSNKGTVFIGLPEEVTSVEFNQFSLNNAVGRIGIGWNSTTTTSGVRGSYQDTTSGLGTMPPARYDAPPTIGIIDVTSLEFGGTAAGTFYGTNDNMMMTISYLG